MIRAVRYRDEQTAMPPKKKLSSTQVAALETWVKLGSPWPEGPPCQWFAEIHRYFRGSHDPPNDSLGIPTHQEASPS